jgi:hypothetical protein
MRAVVKYRKHGGGCRRFAMQPTSVDDKKNFREPLARSWEILAQVRKHDLER